ncbi:hypothetical protein [Catellatospora paridis]|uniref:hypothetical protein n=1 Tax=Catellatospora paridis TaxID=1617086 RepID=UPI0012D43F85|nr:hypothetical protein [Catellatospora paridis]
MSAHQEAGRRTGALTRIDRVLVAALGSALPSQFRARQQAEWAADLADLARERQPAARWRYLLAAAWTLPTLIALARHAQVDGPRSVSPPAVLTARMLAWIVAISLGWTLLSWSVVIAGPYLAFDVPARQAAGIDHGPEMMWPIDERSLPSLLRAALELGGYAAIGMDLVLVAVAAGVTVGFLLLPFRQTWQDRLYTLAGGAVIGTVALTLTAVNMSVSLGTSVTGLTLLGTGIAAAGLAVGRFGLPRRWRIVLGLLAAASFAVVITDNTFGSAMIVWFRD